MRSLYLISAPYYGGAALGASGAVVGSSFGPPGVIAGGIIGGVVGGWLGGLLDDPSDGQLNYNEPIPHMPQSPQPVECK